MIDLKLFEKFPVAFSHFFFVKLFSVPAKNSFTSFQHSFVNKSVYHSDYFYNTGRILKALAE